MLNKDRYPWIGEDKSKKSTLQYKKLIGIDYFFQLCLQEMRVSLICTYQTISICTVIFESNYIFVYPKH